MHMRIQNYFVINDLFFNGRKRVSASFGIEREGIIKNLILSVYTQKKLIIF